jgi:hypothetical protein
MKKFLLGALLLALAPVAQAGPFNDTLSVCLVKKTSEADKQLLVRWIFAALSNHPAVKDLSKVSKEEADRLNREVATLYQALLLDRCGAETRDALKYEGKSAIESSFETLGKVAAQGLMSHADVAAFMGGMEKYLDLMALDVVGPAPAPAKP